MSTIPLPLLTSDPFYTIGGSSGNVIFSPIQNTTGGTITNQCVYVYTYQDYTNVTTQVVNYPYFDYYNYQYQYNPAVSYGESAEERIAREECLVKERVRMEAAASRAEKLLFCCITEEQKNEYLERGYFDTKVSDKLYRIKKGRSGNVVELDSNGKEKYRYCIHPSLLVPDQDTMLAQLLLLHSDERKFLATANRTILHG